MSSSDATRIVCNESLHLPARYFKWLVSRVRGSLSLPDGKNQNQWSHLKVTCRTATTIIGLTRLTHMAVACYHHLWNLDSFWMCLMLANLETRAHWRGDARGLDPNGGTAIKVSAGAGQLVALRSFPLTMRPARPREDDSMGSKIARRMAEQCSTRWPQPAIVPRKNSRRCNFSNSFSCCFRFATFVITTSSWRKNVYQTFWLVVVLQGSSGMLFHPNSKSWDITWIYIN